RFVLSFQKPCPNLGRRSPKRSPKKKGFCTVKWRRCNELFGWEAWTRTRIARSRVWSPTNWRKSQPKEGTQTVQEARMASTTAVQPFYIKTGLRTASTRRFPCEFAPQNFGRRFHPHFGMKNSAPPATVIGCPPLAPPTCDP